MIFNPYKLIFEKSRNILGMITNEYPNIREDELMTVNRNLTEKILSPNTGAVELSQALVLAQEIRRVLQEREDARTTCGIRLDNHGPNKIAVIKVIRTANPGTGLMEAKTLAETPAAMILNGAPAAKARELYDELLALGARVTLIAPVVEVENLTEVDNYDK